MADAQIMNPPANSGQGGDAGKAGAGENHTLSQSEIDSLLGFQGNTEPAVGIRALLDKSIKSYERLPILEVIFARFAQSLSSTLAEFTATNVDVSIDSITSLRFEDYLQSVPLPTLIMIFQAIEWENYGFVTLDSPLCYAMVEVLLGGRRSQQPQKIEDRPFTAIEQEVLKNLGNILLEKLSAAFSDLTPSTFRLERTETIPRSAAITRPSNAVVVLALRMDMQGRGGRVEILIPYATLEPIKDLLLQMFSGESFGADPTWENHFANELFNTDVKLEVMLRPRKITLKELASMKVGATIIMNETASDELTVKCKGIPMLLGRLGKKGNNVALRVSEVFNKNMNELL